MPRITRKNSAQLSRQILASMRPEQLCPGLPCDTGGEDIEQHRASMRPEQLCPGLHPAGSAQ